MNLYFNKYIMHKIWWTKLAIGPSEGYRVARLCARLYSIEKKPSKTQFS
jgi:hypothetical protein